MLRDLTSPTQLYVQFTVVPNIRVNKQFWTYCGAQNQPKSKDVSIPIISRFPLTSCSQSSIVNVGCRETWHSTDATIFSSFPTSNMSTMKLEILTKFYIKSVLRVFFSLLSAARSKCEQMVFIRLIVLPSIKYQSSMNSLLSRNTSQFKFLKCVHIKYPCNLSPRIELFHTLTSHQLPYLLILLTHSHLVYYANFCQNIRRMKLLFSNAQKSSDGLIIFQSRKTHQQLCLRNCLV